MIEIEMEYDIDMPAGFDVDMDVNAVSTTNYNELGNKPSINGVTLSGNKTTAQIGIALNAVSDGNGGVTLSIT